MKRWIPLLLCIVLASPLRAGPRPPASGESELVITVSGLETDEGSVRLAVFDDPERFTDEPTRATVVRPTGGRAEWSLRVAEGTYAVAAVHDVDEDGGLDTNFLGMPREPYGFSNDARGTFGPPSFADASFPVRGDTVRVVVVVR